MNPKTKAIVTILVAIFLSGTPARAQMLDDVTCYKVKAGTTFSHATTDLEALDPTIGDERCSLAKKPRKVCMPSRAQVTETNGESWSTAGEELNNYYVCYKIKCAKREGADRHKFDEFGNHTLLRPRASELCVPAEFGCGDDVEPAEMTGMLLEHNRARSSVPGTSDPPPPLKWDSCMQAGAAAHARKCRFAHASKSERGGAGENIYANGTPGRVTAEQVAQTWASERYVYQYPSGVCTGNMCGHYTQMVWRDTRNLGCAVQVCNAGNPLPSSGPWEFWVCRYDPAGNSRSELPY
jgi:hypothetical protein